MTPTSPSPQDYDNEPMSMEAFRRLPRPPGFKYEYADGVACISVQESALATVVTRPSLVLEKTTSREVPNRVMLRPAHKTNTEALIAAWVDVFVCTPDYHRYPVNAIEREAHSAIDRLFDAEDPSLHPASVVATRSDDLVGALLISTHKTRPSVRAAFVRAHLRRRGLGTAMVRYAAKAMRRAGEDLLCSAYMLANPASALWHASLGFQELPSWLLALHRYRCAEHNLKHGHVWDAFEAVRRVDRLQQTIKDLEEKSREDPDAASGSFWLENDGSRIDAFAERVFSRPASDAN